MNGKLRLNPDQIRRARKAAARIAADVDTCIGKRTTVAVERTVLRLMGVDGVNLDGVPLPNVVVDRLLEKEGLSAGAATWVVNASLHYGLSPREVAEQTAAGSLDLVSVPRAGRESLLREGSRLAAGGLDRIAARRREREEKIARLGEGKKPYLYVIVATGDIYEDIVQGKSAARQGADIVAVIRSTGQSLIDYVPYGTTREGFGGTYATQENFRLMRQGLDEAGEEVGRYIRLCNYCSGLCMPEIAAMGAMERLDVMLNDALYGILFRDINMQRTLIDQAFSRMINGYAGIMINTGEDNYLTTADAVEAAHTVLASQFINEQFARMAGLPAEQMGLGHAFEMDPDLEDGFLMELAQAQMSREIFPNAPLKYMPPTKHMTGNIFKGHIQDAMFNLVGILTGQGVQLLGMMTEAMHTPHIHDRKLAIENARYIFHNARRLGEEIRFVPGGRVEKRAREVLDRAVGMLEEVESIGLFAALERGMLADVKRSRTGGKGLSGVLEKGEDYYNPFEIELRKRLGLGGREEGSAHESGLQTN
ncbi:beta-lysine 5,6-aminomutase alpha subunit /D-lysine 5,6-aminomutase alpha subunit [Melghirimyces profundicolus]|uniref:Beta-lysine 5,6-aminomutase alpha subunit /D-lysine 5,6-aminomutase alpha subunit n=1 Tax=Melghirimyces profundicolus TaxID=1242148 RepID=A0A2T6C2C4_9BACL|nr:lysine 5,6-aminomutase subunit alpha [Melghirimyces profundicolus]PTX62469.1 beta-lysine 5,6-aminomutase alpha subunit /D-lysine 5,6-aminomutase alpha subunit [Melghirimyces profundicolus]